MKMLTAFTYELDDVELAVAEIKEQLNLKQNLRKNAVGILSCYAEFVDTGVVDALCRALPFEVVGSTTLGNATNGGCGMLMLSLTVLTDDHLRFATTHTASLLENPQQAMDEAYHAAVARLPGRPSLILAYFPFIQDMGGELLLECLRRATGEVPIYGTVACDHNLDYREAYTLNNGEGFRSSLSMALIYGSISPTFLVASIPKEGIQKQAAVITASCGNLVKTVNNLPVEQYLLTLGLSAGNGFAGISAIPFVLDYSSGTRPAARVIYMLNGEGEAVCGGEMPEGATLAISSLDHDNVIHTAQQMTETILKVGAQSGALLFSCLSRNMALKTRMEAELSIFMQRLAGVPFAVSYSGGECCPIQEEGGGLVNRIHNFTLTACIF
ncbi:MAG: hypothetical protein GXX99_00540 [Clostridiales bacterium]|nr:hypothetical protein [Clostridiales bacterium]